MSTAEIYSLIWTILYVIAGIFFVLAAAFLLRREILPLFRRTEGKPVDENSPRAKLSEKLCAIGLPVKKNPAASLCGKTTSTVKRVGRIELEMLDEIMLIHTDEKIH